MDSPPLPSPSGSLPLRQLNSVGDVQHSGGNAIYNPSISGPVTFNFTSSEDLRAKYLSRYSDVNPLQERERIAQSKGDLLDGSTAWIFEDPAFTEWDGPFDSTNLLWIHGDAGKGKTMISLSAIDELHQQDQREDRKAAILHFFCAYQDSRLNNAVSVLKGLIYCLLTDRKFASEAVLDCLVQNDPLVFEPNSIVKSPQIQQSSLASMEKSARDRAKSATKIGQEDGSSHAAKDAAEERAIFERDLAKYWTILTSMLDTAALDCVYIVLDALDECGSGCLALLDRVSRRGFSSRVRWFITSRNEPAIAERVHASTIKQMHMSLEENASEVSRSVNSFIEKKVHSLAERKSYDEATTALVKKHLEDNAHDTFLWVSLACKELTDTPAYGVKDALLQLPNGLTSLYERMLSKALDPSDTYTSIRRSILETVSCAIQPMSLVQLTDFVEAPGAISVTPALTRQLVNECGSILTTKSISKDEGHDLVSFVHQSAADYVTALQNTWRLASSHSIHLRLAARSMRIVAKGAQRNSHNFSSEELFQPECLVKARKAVEHTPLQYASKYWYDHLRELRTGTYPHPIPKMPAKSLWYPCRDVLTYLMDKTGPCTLEVLPARSHNEVEADPMRQSSIIKPDTSFEVSSVLSAYTGFITNGYQEGTMRDATTYGSSSSLDWISAWDVGASDAGGLFKVRAVQISSDGKSIALLGSRRFVVLVSLEVKKAPDSLWLRQKSFSLRGSDHPIDYKRASYAPLTNYFAACLQTGGVELWSLLEKRGDSATATWTCPAQWHIPGSCFAFSADSQRVAVGRDANKSSVCIYRTDAKKLIPVIELAPSSAGSTSKTIALSLSPDDTHFAELCDDGSFRFGSVTQRDNFTLTDYVAGLDTSPTRIEFSQFNSAVILWSKTSLVDYYRIIDGAIHKVHLSKPNSRTPDSICVGYMVAGTETLFTYRSKAEDDSAAAKAEIVLLSDDANVPVLKKAGLIAGSYEIPAKLPPSELEALLWKDSAKSTLRFPAAFASTLPPFIQHNSTLQTGDGKLVAPIAKIHQCVAHTGDTFIIKFPQETVFDVFRIVKLDADAFAAAYADNALLPQAGLSEGEVKRVDEFVGILEDKARKAIETGWKDQQSEFKDTMVGRLLWKAVYY